ncbi:MAG TPA: tetratricopeptide repeat protein [Blastocatellia bacterium]|nr:tetratricopeptide repeat protein [Blastocatellia bacterium]
MKRLTFLTLIFFLSCAFNSGAAQEMTVERGRELLKLGRYKEAGAVFTALVAKNSNDEQAQEGLIRVLIVTGDYKAAEARAKEQSGARPAAAWPKVALAEVQFETGRYSDAATGFERGAQDAKGAIFLRATLGQARALLQQGREDLAKPALEKLVRYYNENSPRSAEELTVIAEGLVLIERFKDANELLIDAREADPTFAEAFVAQGELLNEKYNYGDALSLFEDAIKINPNSPRALVGLAECKQYAVSGSPHPKQPGNIADEDPLTVVNHAIEVNPNYGDALAMRAWLELDADDPGGATKAADRALASNPNSVKAMAVRAAVFFLAGDKTALDAETKRALAVNPRAGEFFATLAHFAVNNRRYADAVDFGRRAVELSPRLWSARTELGIQLLRVGRIADGRAELERAFAGDPFNVWAKNTLDLLDSMKDYADTVRGPFLIKSSAKESGVLAATAADLLEEAHKKLTAKYRFTPRGPISVEVFANHEDFAVRSLGLPGLGALGVCFGQVIAMDSPAARQTGEFNWGSTLWHEFTHVITLQITEHRIPRWFSEGLSVYEERRARPGWGENWTIEKLKAFTDGRFVAINELDAAFTRPRSPDGVALAYFQASQVCEFVEEKFGFDAILKMLALYKEGARTPDVLERALKLKPEEFDKAFADFIRAKVGTSIEAVGSGPHAVAGGQEPTKEVLLATLKVRPNDYFAHLRLGAIYQSERDQEKAIEHLKRASEIFPYYAAAGNPYGRLAEIYEARGDKKEAAQALESLTRYNETDAEAGAKLARLRLAMGDRAGALEALKTTFYIQPFDPSLRKLAGDVYLEQGQAAEASREFRALIALGPADLAGAHYDLARSLEATGNRADARREVLRALEIAPGFEKAQELLLKLRGSN